MIISVQQAAAVKSRKWGITLYLFENWKTLYINMFSHAQWNNLLLRFGYIFMTWLYLIYSLNQIQNNQLHINHTILSNAGIYLLTTGWSYKTVIYKLLINQAGYFFQWYYDILYLVSKIFHNHSVIMHIVRLLMCETVKIWKIHWKLKYS